MAAGNGEQVQELLRANLVDELNRVNEEQAFQQREFFGIQGPAHGRHSDSYLSVFKQTCTKTKENSELFVIPERSQLPEETVSGYDKWNTTIKHNFTSCSEITDFPSSSEPNDFQRYFSLGQPSNMSMVDNEMSGEARQNSCQFIIPRCSHLSKDTEPGIIKSITPFSCSETLLSSS